MSRRPRAITVSSLAFIAAGVVGILYHSGEFEPHRPFAAEFVWPFVVRLLAIVGGVYALRGRAWGRWVLLLWLGFHVVLSAFHSLFEFLVHGVLFALVGYFFFRPEASAYFRAQKPPTRSQE